MPEPSTDLVNRQQAALRRVAGLIADGAEASEVFAAVAHEVARVTGIALFQIQRFEPDDTVTVAGAWGDPADPLKPGIEGGARAPIVVEGKVWGVMAAGPVPGQPVPPGVEHFLAGFTELLATAIATTESRAALARLADEQAALRRVATLVAQQVPPDRVFSAVANEIAQLLGIEDTGMVRYEDDDTLTIVATAGGLHTSDVVGRRLPLGGANVSSEVWRTGRAARIDDHSHSSGAVGAFVQDTGASATVGTPIVVDGRLWGALLVTSVDQPLPAGTEQRLQEFTELVATAVSNTEARAEAQRLADEQAALRKIAMLVAQNVPADELFSTVVSEVGTLLGADAAGVGRNLDDDEMEPLAMWAANGDHPPVTPRTKLEPDSLAGIIARTRKPARIDDWSENESFNAALIREDIGARSSVGVPISIDDGLWGMIVAHSKGRFPPDTESRLQRFADLVGTGLSNAQARSEVRRLADEQAALRRVATLVAHEAAPDEVFGAVAEEMGRLLGVDDTSMVRYEPEKVATVVASISKTRASELLGRQLPIGGANIVTRVYETGQAARIDDYSEATGQIGEYARSAGSRSTVGSPIVVDGRLWGAMVVMSTNGVQPVDTADRVAEFTDLVATAIANVETREDLAASRARLVAAADEERRRVVRDLHDGAQQRLVHTVVTLKLAGRELTDAPEPARALIADALSHAESATAELRELAQGIMPSVLSRGGLRAGVDSLASHMPIPVEIDVPVGRLPSAIEATAYFVVAEALTNVVKHANARTAWVAACTDDHTLRVEVRDDGDGGARMDGGGLTGLRDRVAAIDGDLVVESSAGAGTRVEAVIPVRV